MKRKWLYAAVYAFAVLAGWAGSAIAASCAFEATGERAQLELASVEVDDEPIEDLSAYRLGEGSYGLETTGENRVALRFDGAVDYHQRFQPEGESW